MRWLKLLSALFLARFRSKISPQDISRLNFRVWLTDVDASVMNHAAYLTVMEMGRADFMVRSGFFKLARRKKWFFPARSISVQYIRPLKAFQKATLLTRVFYMDEKWIYMEQKIVSNDKVIALAVVKNTVKKGRESIPPKEIASELGFSILPTDGKEIVDLLSQSDELIFKRLTTESNFE